ncbi:mannose-6-phosphate isomerase, class I [Nesterenkonia sp. CL21]|uniref:mannose-6-phosphate isomerase, class I n=1 Tax=Nesterenkonia sp. CL21 TaxID=3064894 RepID=UPI00287A4278|nr:mannose-6-phosphate isomerase, class I [Nesterenkonia sp. CL21]MDS2173205.1 mannose-6-phosphate isomerase, class I [Nesterenkonia sp. CL21]
MTLLRIDNRCMPYDWGSPGRISALLGRPGVAGREAELWLGAHPKAPSRILDDPRWPDAHQWERSTGAHLPFLLKILAADRPLSLQAHPTADQAEVGFAREEAAGIPIDAAHRNYRDPRPKPEMIVALEDGFQALCGFQETAQILGIVDAVIARVPREHEAAEQETPGHVQALSRWRAHLQQVDDGRTHLGAVVAWLLTAEEAAGVVPALLAAEAAPRSVDAEELAPWDLIRRLQAAHPGDPGIAVAVMLHHLTLRAGESLWLPAGVLHAYVQGLGVELMGPSDNVLRGGLTTKHLDVAELLRIADLTPGRPRPTAPMPLEEHLLAHRPEGQEQAPFELMEITGDTEVATPGPSVLIVLDGTFTVSSPTSGPRTAGRGAQLLHTDPGRLRLRGAGRAFLAKLRG